VSLRLAKSEVGAEQLRGAAFGTVVGRVSADVLCVLAETGWTVTVRVPVEMASELPVGQRARLILGSNGWPVSLGLVAS
jgi:hypothetical protein